MQFAVSCLFFAYARADAQKGNRTQIAFRYRLLKDTDNQDINGIKIIIAK